MRIYIIITAIILLFHSTVYSQEFSEDELNEIEVYNANILNRTSHDTTLAKAYLGLSEILYISNLDTLIPLCNTTIKIAKRNLAMKTIPETEGSILL